jgi:DNA-binding NtrC family response regulator
MTMNILMIEQDEDLHGAIVDFLEDRRYDVTACRTYGEAEAALNRIPDRSGAPDAIVSDADGLAFYMAARKRFPDTRWIVTAARHQVAELDNPMTGAVAAAASADLVMSPRLADQFMPGSRQAT